MITRRAFLLAGAALATQLCLGAPSVLAQRAETHKVFLPLVMGGNERGLTVCQRATDCALLEASWWHNWTMTPHLNMRGHVQFARSFGPTWDNQALTRYDLDYLSTVPYGGRLMMFNEPNVPSQGMYAEGTIGGALRYVRDNRPDVQIGLPVLLYTYWTNYGNWGYDYLLPYLTQSHGLTANDIAFSCYHAYGETAAQALGALDLAKSEAEAAWPGLADKPRWVTECGIWWNGWDKDYAAEITALIVGLRQRKIERWAYFPTWTIVDGSGQSYPLALRDANGITEYGEAYRNA